MSKRGIPLARPYITADEYRNVRAVLRSGWLVEGKFCNQMTEQARRVTGATHVALVGNATLGLYAALRATAIGPGDEVIVPSFTYVATANAVAALGAKPVFADISLADYNLDPMRWEERITKRTRAVIPVDLFGAPCAYAAIRKTARRHGLAVIADAACALGATYRGKPVGSLADITVFSLHPRKNVTTGEGGIVATSNRKLFAYINRFRNHGAGDRPWNNAPDAMPDHVQAGLNFRLTDLQAAVGCAQMEKLEYIITRRRMLARRYTELLQPLAGLLALPQEENGNRHIYQSYVVRVLGEPCRAERLRNLLAQQLLTAGIATRPATQCVPALRWYRDTCPTDRRWYANADHAARSTLTLPLFVGMRPAEQHRVVACLHRILGDGVTA